MADPATSNRIFSMLHSSFLSLTGVVVSCALLGAGCTRVVNRTIPASTSTPGVVAPIVAPSTTETLSSPTSTVLSEGNASQLVFLEGAMPDLGKTSFIMTLGTEQMRGRYESSKAKGAIYGRSSGTSTNDLLIFSFYLGDEETFVFEGRYASTTGEFAGSVKRSSEAVSQPIKLATKLPKEGANIKLQKIELGQAFRKGVSCHTTLEYPVILPSNYIPAERANELNQRIRFFLGEVATTTLQMRVEQTHAECLLMQEEMVASQPTTQEEENGLNDYEYETTTLVNRNERGLLSLVYATYTFTGGAHPNSFSLSQAFDLTTGKEVTINTLVRPEALATWVQREQQALLRSEYAEALFDREVAEKLASGKMSKEEAVQTAAYGSLDQWYVNGNTLVRYYQPYEITPYAAGMPSIELPFTSWKDLALPGVERWFR